MKQMSFLQVGLLAVLMVFVASCGVPMGASGDYYEEAPARGDRYYGNLYYGGSNAIIVERDPFTGRYYQVSPGFYGSVYGAPAYPYSRPRYYNRNSTPRNNGYYKKYPQTQPQQTPQRREEVRQNREHAKEAILGKKRS